MDRNSPELPWNCKEYRDALTHPRTEDTRTFNVLEYIKSEFPNKTIKDLEWLEENKPYPTIHKMSKRNPEWVMMRKDGDNVKLMVRGRTTTTQAYVAARLYIKKFVACEPCEVCHVEGGKAFSSCENCHSRICAECIVRLTQLPEDGGKCPICRKLIHWATAAHSAHADRLSKEHFPIDGNYFAWLMKGTPDRNRKYEKQVLDDFERQTSSRNPGQCMREWARATQQKWNKEFYGDDILQDSGMMYAMRDDITDVDNINWQPIENLRNSIQRQN